MSDAIREAFETDVTQIAERHKYQHMGRLLERLSDGCYRQSWVDSAWIGYCAAHARYALQALQSREPVVPEEAAVPDNPSSFDIGWADGWNACRDAMLSASQTKTPQPVVDVNQQLVEALQAVLDCGSTSDQWWIDKAREALLSAGKGGE
jgi:hypothetical protein